MSQPAPESIRDHFNHLSSRVTSAVGSPFALVAAVLLVVIWALSGPIFNFSETWQLVINTSTTIITFLMVFVIQSSQNRDSKAIHLKLDEVIRAVEGARNEFISTEQSTEQQVADRESELLRIAEDAGEAGAGAVTQSPRRDPGTEAREDPDVREAARTHAEADVRREEKAPARTDA